MLVFQEAHIYEILLNIDGLKTRFAMLTFVQLYVVTLVIDAIQTYQWR